MVNVVTLAADLLLVVAASGSALWSWTARSSVDQQRALLSAWALSALFVALSVPATYLPTDNGNDLSVIRQMALNLAIYISPALIAVAVYAQARGLYWSPAGWGRLLLGLFAGFELSRQMGYAEPYLQTLGTAVVATVFAGGFRFGEPNARKTMSLAAVVLGVAFAVASPAAPDWGLAINGQSPAGFSALCALSLLLGTNALRRELAAAAHSQH
ncbi:hypothetical protein ADIMK_0589 [Marinobacterium lacunae]|uniref:Integral membrane protein n=1 Tax=Marinobacterium lacunae TaxID=1232683 RepID=A0A081G282_9GAMM|nr:hypothetical protein [Marinobacterium lacunae]KEA64887.1 hypothetical protein ADIMK_0589 [Marinobacterium lacunae]